MIATGLIKELNDLKKTKYIIITTHKGSLGINTIPVNYIYRENNGVNDYKTFFASFFDKELIYNEKNKLILFKEFLICFEGNKKDWEFRKKIYENNC